VLQILKTFHNIYGSGTSPTPVVKDDDNRSIDAFDEIVLSSVSQIQSPSVVADSLVCHAGTHLNLKEVPKKGYDDAVHPPALSSNALSQLGFSRHNGLNYALQLHKQRRYREAWRIFKLCADEFGDPKAEYYVGFYLSTGDHHVEADHSLAMGYLQRAAEKGVSDAHFLYGLALLRGKGVPKNPVNDALGVRHLRRAADSGNVYAALNYGGMVLNGLYGLTQDIDQGVQWIRRAHEKGHPHAYPNLQSWLTDLKLPVPKDVQLALAQTGRHR
jgi:hypothetical protein